MYLSLACASSRSSSAILLASVWSTIAVIGVPLGTVITCPVASVVLAETATTLGGSALGLRAVAAAFLTGIAFAGWFVAVVSAG